MSKQLINCSLTQQWRCVWSRRSLFLLHSIGLFVGRHVDGGSAFTYPLSFPRLRLTTTPAALLTMGLGFKFPSMYPSQLAQDTEGGQLLQRLSYPPVKLESQLTNDLSLFKHQYQTALVLPNHFLHPATLSIHSGLQLHIQFPQAKPLIMKLQQTPRSSPPLGLFRIYPHESNTLGIYVHDYLPALKKTFPKLKLITHFGYYLKVLFDDRLSRDAFLCILLRQAGCIFDQLQPYFQKIFFKNSQANLYSSGKLEATHSNSQVLGLNYSNFQSPQKNHKQKYLQDNINGSCSYKKKKALRTQANSLDKRQSQSFRYISTLPSEILQSSTSSQDHRYYQEKKAKKEEEYKAKGREIRNQHAELKGIPRKQQNKRRFVMNRNIDKLLCMNMELLEKNQELKAENMQLKSRKSNFHGPSKMGELKSVVETMVHRLNCLEKTRYPLSPKQQYWSANKANPRNMRKRMFSPPAHQKSGKKIPPVKRISKSPGQYHMRMHN